MRGVHTWEGQTNQGIWSMKWSSNRECRTSDEAVIRSIRPLHLEMRDVFTKSSCLATSNLIANQPIQLSSEESALPHTSLAIKAGSKAGATSASCRNLVCDPKQSFGKEMSFPLNAGLVWASLKATSLRFPNVWVYE
jgi:hypothetical protein